MIKKGPIPNYLFDYIYLCSLNTNSCRLSSEVLGNFGMFARDWKDFEYNEAQKTLPDSQSFTTFLSGVTKQNILDFDWILTKDS